MESTDELLKQYELTHVNLCPGALLGVRLAGLGCALVGIEDPRGRDHDTLVVWVEIDRWLADAVETVTGAMCALWNINLKSRYFNWRYMSRGHPSAATDFDTW